MPRQQEALFVRFMPQIKPGDFFFFFNMCISSAYFNFPAGCGVVPLWHLVAGRESCSPLPGGEANVRPWLRQRGARGQLALATHPSPPRERGYPRCDALSLCWAGASPAPGSHSCQCVVLRLPCRFGCPPPPKSHPRGADGQQPGCKHGVLVRRKGFLPRKHTAGLSRSTAQPGAACLSPGSRGFCWGWERTEVSLQPPPPTPQLSPLRRLKDPQGHPKMSTWAGSAVLLGRHIPPPLPSPTQLTGGKVLNTEGQKQVLWCQGFPASSRPATLYPRGALMHFSENGGS